MQELSPKTVKNAAWFEEMVVGYGASRGLYIDGDDENGDPVLYLGDVLCDLLHYALSKGLNPVYPITNGLMNFLAETGDEAYVDADLSDEEWAELEVQGEPDFLGEGPRAILSDLKVDPRLAQFEWDGLHMSEEELHGAQLSL